MMSVRIVFPLMIFVGLLICPARGQDKAPHPKNADNHAGLEQFKQLAGEWVGKENKDGKEVRVGYQVTAGGSAVVETLFPGGEHEMVTVIHPDGDSLLLTHYCMLGNQPQMRASGKQNGNKVNFKFVRATNLKSDKDAHMHEVTYTFVDRDTLRSEWVHYRGGQAAGTVVIELKRQK
jgi:hypothetical protein